MLLVITLAQPKLLITQTLMKSLRKSLICNLLLLACLIDTAVCSAQNDYTVVKGCLISSYDSIPLRMGSIEMLKANGTYISDNKCFDDGSFVIVTTAPKGEYIFRFKAEGHETVVRRMLLDKGCDFGTIILKDSTIRLQAVVIEGKTSLQVTRGDSVIYNPSALTLTPGSTLKDIISQIHGFSVENDELYWHGKPINQILLNGQEFFGENKAIALNNLPADAIEKVKVYDKESTFTEKTGVEDGEKKTVVDVELKEEFLAEWIGDVHAGGGTKEQYELGGFASRITKRDRISVLGETTSRQLSTVNLNNGNRAMYGIEIGNPHTQQYLAEYTYTNGKKRDEAGYFNLRTNVEYYAKTRYDDEEFLSETYLPGEQSSISLAQENRKFATKSAKWDNRMKWQITDKLYADIILQYAYYDILDRKSSDNAIFASSPFGQYSSIRDVLGNLEDNGLSGIATAGNSRLSSNHSSENVFYVFTSLIRKFDKKGRSLSFFGSFTPKFVDREGHSLSDIRYYNIDKNVVNRQYVDEERNRFLLDGKMQYTEPLFDGATLLAVYRYMHERDKGDMPLYQLDSLGGVWSDPNYSFGSIPEGDLLLQTMNRRNSIYSAKTEQKHSVELKMSYAKNGWNLAAGVVLHPQRSELDYHRADIDTTVVRNLFYVAPTLYAKKTFGNYNVDVNYNVQEQYPDLINMLDYTDDTDPLNVSRGNPDLKPTLTHTAAMNMRYFNPNNEFSLSGNINFTAQTRAMSSAVHYNVETGVRTIKPQNVDGNQTMQLRLSSNIKLDRKGYFTLAPQASVRYNRMHSLVSLDNISSLESATDVVNSNVSIKATYRKDKTNVNIQGGYSWEQLQNSIQSNINDTHYSLWVGSYQQIELPLSILLISDIRAQWYRGYEFSQMNYCDYVWDISLKRSFFKDNRLTVTLEWYDVFNSKNNSRYRINDYYINFYRYYKVDSYIMLSIKYNL